MNQGIHARLLLINAAGGKMTIRGWE